MIFLSPSILAANFTMLGEQVAAAQKGGADFIHIDVMDGHFVPNISIGFPVIESLVKHFSIPLDVHLMIDNPEKYIKDFVDAGADIITVHVEATKHIHRLLQMIKQEGIKASVALNPATPIYILDYVLDELDMILIMSVNPGFGGQTFIPAIYEKITRLKEYLKGCGKAIPIQVDGGIGLNNIDKVCKCGAEIIVSGSAIFNSDNIKETIMKMKKADEINEDSNNL